MSKLNDRVNTALVDTSLRSAVLNSCRHSLRARDNAFSRFDDFEAARKHLREIRYRSIDEMDELISQFTSKFTSAGGHVHQASTARDANWLVMDILKRQDALIGVKSKSMVSEEVGLREALGAAGIDAVESDLGEFIVQLAGEPPSHITAPALHRSRRSIGRLFAEKLNVPYTDDPHELTGIARKALRERFLSAEFGLSGANFLIAETGHIVIVENESNARLGLSLPPLYIALTGVEKILPTLADLPPFLKLLPLSSTGQRATSYLHLLRPGQEGEDGPREMHIVMVDNGRRQALADPVLREMLLCIRCGACLSVCPVYQTVGGHSYDSVYPGPMGAVLSNLLGDEPMLKPELPHLSTLCGACRDVCPVKIDIPRLLLELRARGHKSRRDRLAAKSWQWTMSAAPRLEIAGRLARAVDGLLPGGLPGSWFDGVESSFRDALK